MAKTPYIIAFDFADMALATRLADQLSPALCRAKIGKELFTAQGMKAVDMLHNKGYEVFLDLKFHDIPNTVAKAVAVAASAGVWMLNVHASGGRAMMAAARDAVQQSRAETLLIAVTVLTSMSDADLRAMGVNRSVDEQVSALAQQAKEEGLHGVVCSALEASSLRRSCGDGFLLVTPGIRPVSAALDDQQRVLSPGDALAAGSDYLVVGRPVVKADDPRLALERLVSELS